MIVVIDCNIFVMCLTSKSPYHAIFQALVKGKIELAVSSDILLEYEEIIERKYSQVTARAFITLLSELPNVHFVNIYYNWLLISSDPDDNKYCDCAVAGKAYYIVTEDKHFDTLKHITFPLLTTKSIDDFLRLTESL